MRAKSHVSFYIEDDGTDQSEILKKVKIGLEELRDTVDVGSGMILSSETEDLDWINNWKKVFLFIHNRKYSHKTDMGRCKTRR